MAFLVLVRHSAHELSQNHGEALQATQRSKTTTAISLEVWNSFVAVGSKQLTVNVAVGSKRLTVMLFRVGMSPNSSFWNPSLSCQIFLADSEQYHTLACIVVPAMYETQVVVGNCRNIQRWVATWTMSRCEEINLGTSRDALPLLALTLSGRQLAIGLARQMVQGCFESACVKLQQCCSGKGVCDRRICRRGGGTNRGYTIKNPDFYLTWTERQTM